jgi:hypothetical protein
MITDRILTWHDQAIQAGRPNRAEHLLALAWHAYDFWEPHEVRHEKPFLDDLWKE